MMRTITTARRQSLRFEDNIGLVHFQAKRGFRWAQQAGVAMGYEDMYQEASIAFVVAARGFDPDHGVRFSAYYSRVAFSEFRRSIGWMTGVKHLSVRQRAEIATRAADNATRAAAAQAPLPTCRFGLDPTSLSTPSCLPGDGADDLLDTLLSPEGTPDQIVETRQAFDAMIAALSPVARLLVCWLVDPPQALLLEVARRRAHGDYCEAHGMGARGWHDGVTLSAIVAFLRVVANVPDDALKRAERDASKALKAWGNGNE